MRFYPKSPHSYTEANLDRAAIFRASEAEEVNEEVASFLLGPEEARVARQGLVTGGKPEGLLRRLPGHAKRLAGKLGVLLTR